MKTAYQQHLSKLIYCLESLQIDCREKDWQSLAEHEAQRIQLMAKLKTKKADNTQETRELMKKIILLNQALIEIAENNKNLSENALLDVKRKLKRSTFYQ